MQDPLASGCAERRRAYAVALVNQALDDLESERLDVSAAMTLIAHEAWTDGHRDGRCPKVDCFTHGTPSS